MFFFFPFQLAADFINFKVLSLYIGCARRGEKKNKSVIQSRRDWKDSRVTADVTSCRRLFLSTILFWKYEHFLQSVLSLGVQICLV